VVGALDPGDDGQPQLVAGVPAAPVQDVLLQQCAFCGLSLMDAPPGSSHHPVGHRQRWAAHLARQRHAAVLHPSRPVRRRDPQHLSRPANRLPSHQGARPPLDRHWPANRRSTGRKSLETPRRQMPMGPPTPPLPTARKTQPTLGDPSPRERMCPAFAGRTSGRPCGTDPLPFWPEQRVLPDRAAFAVV